MSSDIKVKAKLNWKPKHEDGFCCFHCFFDIEDEGGSVACPRDTEGYLMCDKGYYVLDPLTIKVKQKKKPEETY